MCEEGCYLFVEFLVGFFPDPIQKPDSNTLYCDGSLGLKHLIGFLGSNLVAENLFIGKGTSNMMDNVEETKYFQRKQ